MTGKALPPLSVFHLMRTYGAHGGEQQLSQYFAAEPRGNVCETFIFIYRDRVCSDLFAKRAPDLEQINLGKAEVPTGTAWRELARLLPRLPLLQLRFFVLIRQRRPDICMVQGFQAALVAWPTAVLCRNARWGYVHRITKSATGSNPIFRLIYRPFVAVAGNSKAVTASLAPLTTIDRLVTLENGLDWRRFEERVQTGPMAPLPQSEGPVLLAVGRLLPHKGQSILIDAFNRIADSFSDASLWIVGNGTEMESLRCRVEGSPAARRIHLLGRREDVPALLSRAAVFVNASSWEGMSNAVLEGMAAGLPAVVADAPGVSECHIDGVTGLVVARDPALLAASIARLLSDPGLRQRMGRAARAHVHERYSMEANRRRYLDLFGRMTGRNVCAES